MTMTLVAREQGLEGMLVHMARFAHGEALFRFNG
jgi:hypothetical protein